MSSSTCIASFRAHRLACVAKKGVTDRLTDRQRDYSMPRGSAHRGIMTDSTITLTSNKISLVEQLTA